MRLTLTFMTAALPDDLMIYSRPVTYVTWTAQATDGKKHDVAFDLDASGEIAVNTGTQIVAHAEQHIGGLTVLQDGLGRAGRAGKEGRRPAD